MHKNNLKSTSALILLLTCLLLAVSTSTHAQQNGYSHTCYQSSTFLPTINGQWETEWNNGLTTPFGTNAQFTDQWYLAASTPSSIVYYYLLVETMDNTNDTEDLIQICLNGAMTTNTLPQPTDFAINFTSNNACTWFQGNGSQWIQIPTPSSSTFQYNISYASTPTNSTNHLTLEMSLLKTSTELGGTQIIGPEFWMLIKTYDANTAGYGLQSWPPTPPSSPDNPNTYGDIIYSIGTIPTPVSTPIYNETPNPTPTKTSTPKPTQTPTSTPTEIPELTPTPTSTQQPSVPPQTENESSFNSWDILFIILLFSAESAILATHRINKKKSIDYLK